MAAPQDDKPLPESSGFTPVGTWALLCMIAGAMVIAWLFLYFGIFLPRGGVR
jgi:membrane protein YqaA with SNARE-associated domain